MVNYLTYAAFLGRLHTTLELQTLYCEQAIDEILRLIVLDVKQTIMMQNWSEFVTDHKALELEGEELHLPKDYMLTISKITADFAKHLEKIQSVLKEIGISFDVSEALINPVVRLRERAIAIVEAPPSVLRRLIEYFYNGDY